MKYLLFLIFLAVATLTTSCGEEKDPLLNIIITTLPSDKYDNFSLHISAIRFFREHEERNVDGGILQQWNSASLSMNLDTKQSVVIANDDHWAMDIIGMKLFLSDTTVSSGELFTNKGVATPWIDFVPVTEVVTIENGKQYDVEFIFDLDELILEENGNLLLDQSYEIDIREQL